MLDSLKSSSGWYNYTLNDIDTYNSIVITENQLVELYYEILNSKLQERELLEKELSYLNDELSVIVKDIDNMSDTLFSLKKEKKKVENELILLRKEKAQAKLKLNKLHEEKLKREMLEAERLKQIEYEKQKQKELLELKKEKEKLMEKMDSIKTVLGKEFNLKLMVNVNLQKLYLINGSDILKEYPVSTSKYGIGNDVGSNKTPLGEHIVYKKIGDNAPLGTIFVSRENTGRISEIYRDNIERETDSVLTRIMWLDGIEKGINENSRSRFIYIHGTPEEGLIGSTASHGCIRMKNSDVVEIYDLVGEGTKVEIVNE